MNISVTIARGTSNGQCSMTPIPHRTARWQLKWLHHGLTHLPAPQQRALCTPHSHCCSTGTGCLDADDHCANSNRRSSQTASGCRQRRVLRKQEGGFSLSLSHGFAALAWRQAATVNSGSCSVEGGISDAGRLPYLPTMGAYWHESPHDHLSGQSFVKGKCNRKKLQGEGLWWGTPHLRMININIRSVYYDCIYSEAMSMYLSFCRPGGAKPHADRSQAFAASGQLQPISNCGSHEN